MPSPSARSTSVKAPLSRSVIAKTVEGKQLEITDKVWKTYQTQKMDPHRAFQARADVFSSALRIDGHRVPRLLTQQPENLGVVRVRVWDSETNAPSTFDVATEGFKDAAIAFRGTGNVLGLISELRSQKLIQIWDPAAGKVDATLDRTFLQKAQSVAEDMRRLFQLSPYLYARCFPQLNAEALARDNQINVDPRFEPGVLEGVLLHEFGHLALAGAASSNDGEALADLFAGAAIGLTGRSMSSLVGYLKSSTDPLDVQHGTADERIARLARGFDLGLSLRQVHEARAAAQAASTRQALEQASFKFKHAVEKVRELGAALPGAIMEVLLGEVSAQNLESFVQGVS